MDLFGPSYRLIIQVKLSWTGGTPPFMLQSKTEQTAWQDFLTISDRTTSIAPTNTLQFFRLKQ